MTFFENTDRYRQIFTELKNSPNFHYTNKQISELTGFDPSKLSRFFNRKRDLNAGEFFYLLECMPTAFQEEFWSSYNPNRSAIVDLATTIKEMNLSTIGNLLQLIGTELQAHNPN